MMKFFFMYIWLLHEKLVPLVLVLLGLVPIF